MASQARTQLGPPARCPLSFVVDGYTYTLPELDTRTWLDTLPMDPPGCWWHLLPGQLSNADQEHVVGRLFHPDDDLDLDDVETAAEAVLAAVLGMDLWAAHRLAGMVHTNWALFDGWSYKRGVDPLGEPPGRVLSAAYVWRRDMCEKKSELARLDTEIFAPGPELMMSGNPRDPAPAGWDDEQESAVFAQAMAQATGGG